VFSGRTFLVTGATGRLGCHLVPRLEQLGAVVLPLVLPGYPSEPKSPPWTATAAPIPVTGPTDLDRLPTCEAVIHLHWTCNRTLGFRQQLAFELGQQLSTIGFFWDWLLARRPSAFVNVSTTKVYSEWNESPIRSETEPRPTTPYGIAKYTVEKYVDSLLGVHTRIAHVRLCSVASPGEHPSQLMTQLYQSAFKGRRITVNAGHVVYLLYVDDAVDFLLASADKVGGGRYLIAPEAWKIEAVARTFEETTGRKLTAELVDLSPGAPDPVFLDDADKLDSGWVRRTSLKAAVAKFVAAREAGTSQ
jgi:nucleoside-diphosphate-sugar epimerase